MDQQILVNVSKGEKGRGETWGVADGLNLGKRGVKRVGSGLNISGGLEKAWSVPVTACVQNVSSESGGMVEEMRVLDSFPVGSTNSFDRGQVLMTVSQEGIAIEWGMDDTHLFVACHSCYWVFHTQRLSAGQHVGVFGGDESW